MLDKAALQKSQQQWQEVAEIERKEECQGSPLERWKKLNALIRMAPGLNLIIEGDTQGKEAVWERWNKLRELYLSKGVS